MDKRIKELKEEIKRLDDYYYKQGISGVSDLEYDMLTKELADLELKMGVVETKDGSGEVGSDHIDGFARVKHNKRMLSIPNSYSSEDLRDFDTRVKKLTGLDSVNYCVELKIDGVALSLTYRNGKILKGVTRGDGEYGDDITKNIQFIHNLPETIDYKGEMEVRGEIYMEKGEFLKLNEEKIALGEKSYANPRNLAAGSIKMLDKTELKKRALKVITYSLVTENLAETHSGALSYLKDQKLPSPDYYKVCSNIDDVIEEVSYWESRKDTLPYEIDGMVIKVDNLSLYPMMGETAKYPRYIMSYKFKADQKETLLKEIKFQVGRTGAITPVAILEPVTLAGTVVQHATLHNAEEIIAKDLRIGDRVIVEKAGEIIPQVVSSVKSKRSDDSIPFTMIDKCPSCSTNLVKIDDEVAYRCVNYQCPAQLERRVEHFVSKGAMDIGGLGERIVAILIDKELIKDIGDIYLLSHQDISNLDRMGDRSAENLITSINNSKSAQLDRLIFGLGVRFVGSKASTIVAKHFKTMDALSKATYTELINLEEIGEKIAASIHNFFKDEINIALIERLREYGLNFDYSSESVAEDTFFSGKKFVITGTLQTMGRSEAKNEILKRGGDVIGSVSKKTDYLVAGEKAGSKLKKANDLGIPVLDEEQFKNYL